jgi:hypothetical protein
MVHGTRQNNRKEYMTKQSAKKLKPEYQAGGPKRQVILDKAVQYISDTRLSATQGDRHYFLVNQLGLTETEYLECLNKATNGELVRNLWN